MGGAHSVGSGGGGGGGNVRESLLIKLSWMDDDDLVDCKFVIYISLLKVRAAPLSTRQTDWESTS